MDYHNHHRIGPHVSNSMPYFYDFSKSSAYRTPRLPLGYEAPRFPPVTEAPRLPPAVEKYKINAVNVGSVIHGIELEAYAAVLKAFKIQSDSLSWGKEGLITELRKELNVTDQEHRMFLTLVNSDKSLKMIRELQQGVFQTREMPSSIIYAPGSGPYSISSTLRNNDVSIMQNYVAHGQPISESFPPLRLQNCDDGFRNGELSAYNIRNTEMAMRVVAPNVPNHSEKRYRGPVQPQPKNLIHVAEVHNLKKKSQIIKICATETVLTKVQNMVYGRENPSPDQVEKAKSMLMEQERAILEALAKLADVTHEGHQDQQEFQEELNMMGKWDKTPENVYYQADYRVRL